MSVNDQSMNTKKIVKEKCGAEVCRRTKQMKKVKSDRESFKLPQQDAENPNIESTPFNVQ